jgi:hypothetical protein
LVLHGDRLLAQGIMTYTAAGGSSDLAVTAAVDVHVGKAEQEVDRDPAAAQWQNQSYTRINLAGVLKLTNYRDDPISLEVVRHVLGNVDSADNEGRIRKVSVYEDSVGSGHGGRPDWWGWYNWPHWWHHFNGIGRIDWNLTLEPGKQIDLAYTWHYYWR